jgi:hypothetical protein
MEIQLPKAQSYLDNIKNGSITEIRLPRMEAGEVLTAFSSAGNSYTINLKVLSSETVPQEAITAEEAEREGFAVPDFCTFQFLCGNIETRLDFEDYAFKHEQHSDGTDPGGTGSKQPPPKVVALMGRPL